MKKQVIYFLLAALLVFAAVLTYPALSSGVRKSAERNKTEISENALIGKKKPKKIKTTNKKKRKQIYRPGARQN